MQRVVIVGIGYTSRLGFIRSLGELGYIIELIILESSNKKTIDQYSKYVKKVYSCHGNDEASLLHIPLTECIDKEQKTILIPNNDFSATVLDKNYNLLKDYYLFPHIRNTQGAITDWMNKEKQKAWASSVGLNVVESKNVIITDRKYELPVGIHYPCFTKTRAYVTGYKHTLHRCDNEIELRAVLDYLCTKHENLILMVEDYKEIDQEYAVVGFSDGNEVIIPCVLEILSMAQGNVKGVASQGKVVPLTGYEEIIGKFNKFILGIGFVGLFDIDFYLSDGLLYFGELNLRIGGSGSAVVQMGVNLPEMLVRTMLGRSLVGMKKEISSSAVYVNERIVVENWYYGYLTTKELINILHSSSISFVKDKHDPLPGFIFKKRLIMMWLKRFLKKYLKK